MQLEVAGLLCREPDNGILQSTLMDEDAEFVVLFELSGYHLNDVFLEGDSSLQYFMLTV